MNHHFSPALQRICLLIFVPKKHLLQQIQGVFLQLLAVGWSQNLPRLVRPYWHRARNQIRPDRSGGGPESLSVTGESCPLQNIGPIKLRGPPPKKKPFKNQAGEIWKRFSLVIFVGVELCIGFNALAGGFHIFDFQAWQSKACRNGIFVVPSNDATKPIL